MPVGIENKQEVSADPKKDVEVKDIQSIYTTGNVEEDKRLTEYMGRVQRRLEDSRIVRNSTHVEWNNKGYIQKYEERQKISHTFLEPKKNDDDVLISSTTLLAQKLHPE